MYVLCTNSRNGCLPTRCNLGLLDDMLPDDILLSVFDFCPRSWRTLIHVCRRWRSLVFGSPRRLDLCLFCSPETPARDTLDIWPPLPLVVQGDRGLPEGVDNIVAALERSDRVRQIDLSGFSASNLKFGSATIQEPFPELTHLQLWSDAEAVQILPDSFLGGSVPRLQYLFFRHISFPGLPNLLLSAIHLVDLRLWNIPHSGYFLPATMVTALSTMTSLRELHLAFESPRSCPDQANRRPPPPIRFALPVLTNFYFKGVCEYLEDLMAHIDAPRLDDLTITFFNDIVFDSPQVKQFISRTPMPKALKTARVFFQDGTAVVNFPTQRFSSQGLTVNILCKELDWQVASLEQVCTLCLPPFSILERLYISESLYPRSDLQGTIENTQWLDLLHPFMAVKNLYLSRQIAQYIVPALQELVGSRTTEVLPTLQNIFLEEVESSGSVQEDLGRFVATRQEGTSHLIAVSRWNR